MKDKKSPIVISNRYLPTLMKINSKFKNDLSRDFKISPLMQDIEKIRKGEILFEDSSFDNILPSYYKFCSNIQWTPFAVARVIGQWLKKYEHSEFLDIGCGVGKLCVYLALTTSLKINGIEKRKNLVDVANEIIKVNDIERIKIIHGNILDLKWQGYDVFYMFNPFYEHVVDNGLFHIDTDLDFNPEKYYHYANYVYESLDEMGIGKILITYHGFGRIPSLLWKLRERQKIGMGNLELWEKVK